MKQKLLYIFFFVFSVLLGTERACAWGESTSYVLNTGSNEVDIDDKTVTYELSGVGATLTFYVLTNATNSSSRKVSVYAYNSATKQDDLLAEYTDRISSFTLKTLTLNTNHTSVKFKGAYSWSSKKIKDVMVTRANTLTASPSSIDFGEVPVGTTATKSITVTYNNTTYDQQLTATNSNSSFSLNANTWTTGETGSVNFNVSISPTAAETFSDMITLKKTDGTSTTVSVTATAVIKILKPEFEMNLSSVYRGHVYTLSDYFSSNNTSTPCKFTSHDSSKGYIRNGQLFILGDVGSTFTITAVQDAVENAWETHTQTFNITITEGDTETHRIAQNDFKISEEGEKILTTPAPCKSVSYYMTEPAAVSYETNTVEQSLDHGLTWKNIKTFNPVNDGKDYEDALDWSATHVRFYRPWGHTATLYTSNIYFHLAAYMTPSNATLSFDDIMEGRTSSTQSLTIDWCDVENYNSSLQIFSDSENFTPTNLDSDDCIPYNQSWGNTCDRWGRSTLDVQYTPQTAGTHSGYIYFHDSKRFTRIKVSGTAYSNHLQLQPTVDLNTQHPGQKYPYVTLNRTLNEGYSTLTLPFDTKVSELSGYAVGDYVAQLSLVTYNKADGYTLFFKKVADGIITAHQPYVIYRTAAMTTYPQWINCHVEAPQTSTVSGTTDLKGWKMTGNYTPGFSMSGKYGIANGKLALGGASSTLNAYTAYFEPPTNGENIRTRVAIMDDDGNATYIGEIRDGRLVPEAIYGADGIRQTELKNGINIVRTKDGRVRKIWKR